MSIFSALNNFFNPDAETSAKRRLDVFGTESKIVAGGLIIGSAAALVAAPFLVAEGGGASAVLKSAGSALASTSGTTKFGIVLAAPIVLGAVASQPKIITRTAGGLVNFEQNLYKAGKDPTIQSVTNVFKENPLIATAATAAGLIAVGGAGLAASGINSAVTRGNTKAVERSNDIALGGGSTSQSPSGTAQLPLPGTVATLPPAAPEDTPLTRETQVLGKEVKSGSVKRSSPRREKTKPNNVNVKILNQNTYIHEDY